MELSIEEFIKKATALYTTPVEKVVDFSELQDMQFQESECLFVWEMATGSIKFSVGFKELLGHDTNDMNFANYLSSFHPEDASIVNSIAQESIMYLLKNPKFSEDSALYVMFRMIRKDGSVVKILSRSTVFRRNEEGQLLYTLVRLTNIDFTKVPDVVSYRFEAKGLDIQRFHQSVYGEHLHLFTKRELEVIKLIRQGMSNLEISHQLGISKHTIATHRKKILHKSKCHTADELILFCLRTGVLR